MVPEVSIHVPAVAPEIPVIPTERYVIELGQFCSIKRNRDYCG